MRSPTPPRRVPTGAGRLRTWKNRAYEAAVADYSEAIALAPTDAESHAGRATAAAFQGRDAEADADAARAVELGFNRYLMAAMLAEARRNRG